MALDHRPRHSDRLGGTTNYKHLVGSKSTYRRGLVGFLFRSFGLATVSFRTFLRRGVRMTADTGTTALRFNMVAGFATQRPASDNRRFVHITRCNESRSCAGADVGTHTHRSVQAEGIQREQDAVVSQGGFELLVVRQLKRSPICANREGNHAI